MFDIGDRVTIVTGGPLLAGKSGVVVGTASCMTSNRESAYVVWVNNGLTLLLFAQDLKKETAP